MRPQRKLCANSMSLWWVGPTGGRWAENVTSLRHLPCITLSCILVLQLCHVYLRIIMVVLVSAGQATVELEYEQVSGWVLIRVTQCYQVKELLFPTFLAVWPCLFHMCACGACLSSKSTFSSNTHAYIPARIMEPAYLMCHFNVPQKAAWKKQFPTSIIYLASN